jgi:hypothetical protein
MNKLYVSVDLHVDVSLYEDKVGYVSEYARDGEIGCVLYVYVKWYVQVELPDRV